MQSPTKPSRSEKWWSIGFLCWVAFQIVMNWYAIVAAVQTRWFWITFGYTIAGIIVGGAVLIAVGYLVWKFCVWFDVAIKREQARIAKRVAAYHGGHEVGGDEVMHDAEIDG